MSARASYDVAVAGAGPAGAAAAIRLARAGRSVVLLERTHLEEQRVGETLPPSIHAPLQDLGVWQGFRRQDPLPSWGTLSAWSDGAPHRHSHLHSGYASGWHVDRVGLDRMLALTAVDAGAELRTGAAVAGCRREDGVWHLRCVGGHRLSARILLDATGKRARIGRGLDARRLAFDRQVAVVTRWAAGSHLRALHVVAAPEGWWYAAPVPGGALVIVLLTDADLCRRAHLSRPGVLASAARSTPGVAELLGSGDPDGPRLHPAGSHRLHRPQDTRPWIAVGDAALAVDPLTGSGVLSALRAGRSAAGTVAELLDRPGRAPEILSAREAALDAECTAYLEERAAVYARVARFTTPYWRRRRLAA